MREKKWVFDWSKVHHWTDLKAIMEAMHLSVWGTEEHIEENYGEIQRFLKEETLDDT